MKPIEGLTARLEEWTGIAVRSDGQLRALERCLADRARELGRDLGDYVDSLRVRGDPAVQRLINDITVNYTWFYRDHKQLEGIGCLLRSGWSTGRALQIWVAGCSTGEDAYTLKMLAVEAQRQVNVLATDINTEVLAYARSAWYDTRSLRELPQQMRIHFNRRGALHEVTPHIRDSVPFMHHNLLDGPPPVPTGGFDLVLCRNVLIYFRPETRTGVLEQVAQAVRPGGWLLVGGSEVLHAEPGSLEAMDLGGRKAFHRPLCPLGPSKSPTGTSLGRASSPPGRRTQAHDAITPSVGPRTDPRTPALVSALACGHQRLDAGCFSEALSFYADALRIDPLCAEALLFTGVVFHKLEDSTAAIRAFRSALLLDPKLWLAAFYLALNYELLDQHQADIGGPATMSSFCRSRLSRGHNTGKGVAQCHHHQSTHSRRNTSPSSRLSEKSMPRSQWKTLPE